MKEYLLIIFSAVFVNNVVFVRILGLCPFMGVSKKLNSAYGMGMATAFVLTMATAACWIIEKFLLVPFDLTYLRIVSFIMTIAAFVQLTELIIHKISPQLHQILGIYLPLITTNCAVLGIPLLALNQNLNFFQALIFGASSSLGFSLALILFASIRERIDGAEVPQAFRGAPIALITAGLMSLAFMGFSGLDKY